MPGGSGRASKSKTTGESGNRFEEWVDVGSVGVAVRLFCFTLITVYICVNLTITYLLAAYCVS